MQGIAAIHRKTDSSAPANSAATKAASDLLYRPLIAWPTVGLLIASLLTWALAFRFLSPWCAVPVAACCIYSCFTVLHDASHHSLSKIRWINNTLGHIASVPFIWSSFALFRYVHLQHHKHTNDHKLDPITELLRVLPSSGQRWIWRIIAGHSLTGAESQEV